MIKVFDLHFDLHVNPENSNFCLVLQNAIKDKKAWKPHKYRDFQAFCLEQMTGIEPASSAWEAEKNRLYHSIKSPFLNFFDLHLTCIE